MTVSDAPALVARARQGDSDAFQVLVEKHSRAAFRLAYRLTGNEHDAEDVVQESFLKAFRYLGRFEDRADFGTWLYRIVTNCAIELLRVKQSREHRARMEPLDSETVAAPSSAPGPERLAESAQLKARVAAALEGLSPLERAAFTLRHYEGRSTDEIGRTLRLGTSATKHAVFRAVKKLRACLAGIDEHPCAITRKTI
jgi:RNA polymerase sigma-70 factor (ECF subfamily)